MSSMESVRSSICSAAGQLFGRPVSFEERAYQALEIVTKRGTTPQAVHVWAQLASSTPAVHQFLEELGVRFEGGRSPWPAAPRPLKPWDAGAIDWGRAVRGVFCVEDSRTPQIEYTNAGRDVAASGIITVRHLATSIFESGRISFRGTRLTNTPFRALARGAGIERRRAWSEDIDAFSSHAVAAFNRIYACDPSYGAQQFILYHDGKSIRFAPFGVFGGYQLQEAPLPDGSLWVARANLVQGTERFAPEAISALEELINRGAQEGDFQAFFEEHPEFLLAIGDYVRLHPQLVLSEDDGRRLIPDFFLEKMNSNFCDVCDLKRPSAELVRHQRNRGRFRDAVMEAAAQLTYYRDYFEDRQHRDSFHRRYGLNAYRPRMVVIIGRQRSFYDEVERIALESQLPSWVVLKTYDDVLLGVKRWKQFLEH